MGRCSQASAYEWPDASVSRMIGKLHNFAIRYILVGPSPREAPGATLHPAPRPGGLTVPVPLHQAKAESFRMPCRAVRLRDPEPLRTGLTPVREPLARIEVAAR